MRRKLTVNRLQVTVKTVIILLLFFFTLYSFPLSLASAHVVVKPTEVGMGAFQTFTMGVPNEKDNPTIALRLVIPEGLKHVSPNVKPGWTINIKKEGTGEDAKVTEISWAGGTVPAGQRDDFIFSAQVPASETALQWKAYQTYQDGTIVSWDQTPGQVADHEEMENSGPFSQTKIINDLKTPLPTSNQPTSTNQLPLILSLAALGVSITTLVFLRKK